MLNRMYLSVIFLVAFFLLGCSGDAEYFNSKDFSKKTPNATLQLYLHEYGVFCPSDYSNIKIKKSDKADIKLNNTYALSLLREGLCHAVNGELELAALYMYRTIHYSDLVPTDGVAKKIALSYLSEPSVKGGNIVDSGWSNNEMLKNNVSLYHYPEDKTLKQTQAHNRSGLYVFYGKSYNLQGFDREGVK